MTFCLGAQGHGIVVAFGFEDSQEAPDPVETPVESLPVTDLSDPDLSGPNLPDETPDTPILPTNGNDAQTGTAHAERIAAGGGNDTLQGNAFGVSDEAETSDADTLFGGAGDDYLRGYNGPDSLDGGDGNDTLWADTGDDTLIGGAGNDEMTAMEGDDLLDGGDGNNRLNGQEGSDTLLGGAGDDVLNYRGISGAYTGPTNDLLDGGDGDDVINAGSSSTLTGGLGADTLNLEELLSDSLVAQITDFDPTVDGLHIELIAGNGDGGEVTLQPRDGGTGSGLSLGDDLVVEFLGNALVTLADINLTVSLEYNSEGRLEYTIGNSADDIGTLVTGSYSDDVITGSDSGDVIAANGGSDLIDGGAGNDTIFADGGDVQYYYHDNAYDTNVETDTITGGRGDDMLISIDGNVVTGGEGDDLFVIRSEPAFRALEEPLPPTTITDFTPGEDTILVRPVPGTGFEVDTLELNALADGSGAELRLDGQVIAIITGGQDLTLADLNIGEMANGDYVPYGPYNVIPGFLS